MDYGISRRGWLAGVFGGLVAWLAPGGSPARAVVPANLGPRQVCFFTKENGRFTAHVCDLQPGTVPGITSTNVYSAAGAFLHVKQET